MARYSLEIAKDSPLHQKLAKKIETRIKLAADEQQLQHDKWRRAEEITLAYLPETEADGKRRAERERGVPKYTTIQIPYSFAVLMSAHAYWTSVFFARNPVHQYTGRHGEGEQQTQAMEALIGYQVDVGSMLGPYYIWLYDAGKYGAAVVGTYWDKQKLHYGQLVEMENPATGQLETFQVTQELPGYMGNRVYNVSPWDFLHDPRVSFKNFQQGEFCAVRCRLGWNKIVQRRDAGYFNKNVDDLKGHVEQDKSESDGSDQLKRPVFSKTIHDDVNDKHPAGAVFYEFYVELIPKEWGVGETSYPQKWCFTITQDCKLIVGATPLPNIHCQFPFDVIEQEVEGYGTYARGTPEIMEPLQNTVDWLVNTHFFNVRASMNNQFIVDPSKLVIKDVQNTGPGFLWRLRPEAYGTDINKMFHQVTVTDMTRGHMSDFQAMIGIGERTLGINDQIMGAMNTGQRKTATEVRTTTGFGVNRQKTITEYMSATGFAPHSQKLVQNSQQFYDATAKLRRVGSFALEAGQNFINVSPQDIHGFFDFVPVDGNLPIDRMAIANLWKEVMASVTRMPPQVVMEYDWARIFAWTAQQAGLKNINQFKIQVVPDAAIGQNVQAGNVIPMPQRQPPGPAVTPGNSASTASGLEALQGGGPGVESY